MLVGNVMVAGSDICDCVRWMEEAFSPVNTYVLETIDTGLEPVL